MYQRNGPVADASADRALDICDGIDFTDPFAHRQHSYAYDTRTLRRIARTLRDDGLVPVRVRQLALNASRQLAGGFITPADAQRLIHAYRIRRAVARAAARVCR